MRKELRVTEVLRLEARRWKYVWALETQHEHSYTKSNMAPSASHRNTIWCRALRSIGHNNKLHQDNVLLCYGADNNILRWETI